MTNELLQKIQIKRQAIGKRYNIDKKIRNATKQISNLQQMYR